MCDVDPEHNPLLNNCSQPQYSSTSPSPAPSKSSSAQDNLVLPESSPLGRTLSRKSAYIIALSRVIGSGIFATPGAILRTAGSPGLSLLIWVVGAIFAACGLAVSLEYGCMLPRSGGVKVYLEFTYRRPRLLASVLVAVNAIFLGFTASNCVIFSQYSLFAAGVDGNSAGEGLRKGLAAALLLFVTFIHAVTPKFGVRLQNILGWLKIAIIAFMFLAGSYVVLFRPNVEPATSVRFNHTAAPQSWDELWQGSSWSWGSIAPGLFQVFYAYAGLDNVSNVLNEVKDPVRTLRTVSLAALATSCAMYFLINVAYFLVVPVDVIKGSGELIAALFFQRVFGGRVGNIVLPLAIALSAAGNVFVVVFAMARLKQEIARQGLLPWSDILSSTKPFNSPLGGLIINFIPSLLMILLPPSREVYSFILETEGFSAQIFGLAIGAGLIWLRLKRPDLKRPFRAWNVSVAVRLVLSLALLAAPFFPPKDDNGRQMYYATYAVVGITIVFGSVLYWYIWAKLLPRVMGYKLEEQPVVLADGTSIVKIVKKQV